MFSLFRSVVHTFAGLASEDFTDWVHARAGEREHASFFDGSFTEAMTASADTAGPTKGRGLLLLWLHEREDENTEHLCRQVWTHAGVREELRERFVAWAGDVFRYEASSLLRLLRTQTCPTLVCIQKVTRGAQMSVEWPRGYHFRIFFVDGGRIDGGALHAALVELGNACDSTRQQETAWRQQIRQMEDLSRSLVQALGTAQAETDRRRQRAAELQRVEEEERSCFEALYLSTHDSEPPPHFDGTFAEALSKAQEQRRLLLVWLYDAGETSTALCREVLNGEVFSAFVSEYFVLWPGDAERWLLPVQLRELLRLQSLPSLLVLQPMSVYDAEVPLWSDPAAGSPVEFPAGSAWALLGGWDATSAGTAEEEVISFLAEHGDRAAEAERKREEERKQASERAAEVRALRELQDKEFEESLLADQAREAKKQEEALGNTAAKAEAAEAAAKKTAAASAAAAAKAAEEDALIQKRRAAAEKLLAVTQPTSDRCRLVLRLPGGRRAERSFGADEPLAKVLEWADCCGELCGLEGGEPFDVPSSFSLATTYPRAVLRDGNLSLRQLQLVPNAVLALVPEDN